LARETDEEGRCWGKKKKWLRKNLKSGQRGNTGELSKIEDESSQQMSGEGFQHLPMLSTLGSEAGPNGRKAEGQREKVGEKRPHLYERTKSKT